MEKRAHRLRVCETRGGKWREKEKNKDDEQLCVRLRREKRGDECVQFCLIETQRW